MSELMQRVTKFQVKVSKIESEVEVLNEFSSEFEHRIIYLHPNYKLLDKKSTPLYIKLFESTTPLTIQKVINPTHIIKGSTKRKFITSEVKASTETSLEIFSPCTANLKKKNKGCSAACAIS